MLPETPEVMQRKLSMLRQFLSDLELYAAMEPRQQRREHYAIERLLQLLCESSADIGLQLLRSDGYRLAATYRDVFEALRDRLDLDEALAERLMDACAMRNVLTHLYDTIDLERVIGAVTPAIEVYGQFAQWAEQRL